MKFRSIVKGDPIEMLVSEKKLKVPMCVEAMSEIAKANFGFKVEVADNYIMIGREENEVCVISFIEKGLVVLRRNMCPDFVLLLRIAVATMGELHTKEQNDFSELQDIFGQRIDFRSSSNQDDEDTEEITSCDPQEASLDAMRRLFSGVSRDQEENSPGKKVRSALRIKEEEEEDSDDDSEWI